MTNDWKSAYDVVKGGPGYPESNLQIDIKFGDGEYQMNTCKDMWLWNADSDKHPNVNDVVAWRYSSPIIKAENESITSTGGSSSYYELSITNKHGDSLTCETGDVIASLVGDNFALGNIVKALRRIHESSQGRGKAGVTMEYDVNKCKYFLDDFLARNSRKDNLK